MEMSVITLDKCEQFTCDSNEHRASTNDVI